MDWKKVIDMPDGAGRDHEFSALIQKLPELNDAEREQEIRQMIEAEYSQDEEGLREITQTRLQAVLALDDEAARKVAETYDSVMNTMPGDIAFRRAAVVQTTARHQFSVDEEAKLRELVPNVLGEKPKEISVDTPGPQEPVEAYPKRRWWMFWQSKKAKARKDADVIVPDIEDRGFSDEVLDQMRRTRQV